MEDTRSKLIWFNMRKDPCTNEKCVECGDERLEGLQHCNCECHFGYTCENCGHEGR